MGPVQSTKTCLQKTLRFSGRAAPSEFGWFTAFCIVVFTALYAVEAQVWGWTLKNGTNSSVLTAIFHLVIALPFLAVMLRRAQDIGFHPVIVFLPAILLYFRYELLGPIAMGLETAQGLQGSEARAASFRNPVGQLALQLRFVSQYLFFALVMLLALLPTNFARRIPILSSPNDEVPQ